MLVITDSAANILNGANSAGVGFATNVILTGTSNLVTAAQATQLEGMANFRLWWSSTLTVMDSTANLLDPANAAGLSVGTNYSYTYNGVSFEISGTSNVVSLAQEAVIAALPHVSLAAGASVTLADTAANLIGSFDSIGSSPLVTAISVTDGLSLTLTYAQFVADAATIAEIVGPYTLHVSGVPVAAAAAMQANSHVVAFQVSDTAAAVGADLTPLDLSSSLSAITLTDSSTLPLSYNQMAADARAIGLITNAGLTFTVSMVPVSAAASEAANPNVVGLGWWTASSRWLPPSRRCRPTAGSPGSIRSISWPMTRRAWRSIWCSARTRWTSSAPRHRRRRPCRR